MSARQFVFALLLLLCGFSVGVVLIGGMRTAGERALAEPAPVEQSSVAAPAPAAPTQPAAPPAATAPSAAPAALPDFSRVAERSIPAVVNVSSRQIVRRQNSPFATDPFFPFFADPNEIFGSPRSVENSLGSGVIVSRDGYILTNNHVVTGQSRRRVNLQSIDITVALSDKREMAADVIGVDSATDLALLKVDATNLPAIPWGDSQKLKVAEWVLAIGNPYQLSETVTLGIVSAVNRQNVGINAYEDFIQTDAAINPGNSGGALINARGELVGINTAIFSQSGGYQGIGFAVASNLARRVQRDLQEFGEVRRGSIGYVQVMPLTTRQAAELGVPDPGGFYVARMDPNSSAYEGGLRPGDVIVAFNGQPVAELSQLSRTIQDSPVGRTATLTVIRERHPLDLRVRIQSSTSNQ
jgi:Do/DeqQ family serine protease